MTVAMDLMRKNPNTKVKPTEGRLMGSKSLW
jgi:hypothetical protein